MPHYADKERAPRYSEPLERWRRAIKNGNGEAADKANADWHRHMAGRKRARSLDDRAPGRGYGLLGKVA